MNEREELDFEQLLERIGQLFEELQERLDGEVHDRVFELLDYVEAYHREAVTRLAMAMPPDVLDAAHEDPIASHILELYLGDEHADEAPDVLIEQALEEIRPYVHSHGGEMELVDVRSGVVTLRLMGACDGCPASSATLTQGVETALRERWSGFRGLRVEGDPGHDHDHGHGQKHGGEQLLQIQSLKRR